MRYKPKSVSALQVTLGGLPAAMHVEAMHRVMSFKTVLGVRWRNCRQYQNSG
jgi:hypothetical protein